MSDLEAAVEAAKGLALISGIAIGFNIGEVVSGYYNLFQSDGTPESFEMERELISRASPIHFAYVTASTPARWLVYKVWEKYNL